MTRTIWISLAVIALAVSRVEAGFVVIANMTDSSVRFTISHTKADPRSYALVPGETRQIPVGRVPEFTLNSANKSTRFRLEPYGAYAITSSRGNVAFQGIELASPLPKPGDIPEAPPRSAKPYSLAVALLVDDADLRAQAVWEKALRKRAVAASEILERECGVTLNVVSVGDWSSNPQAKSADALLTDFEKKVTPRAGSLAIGFSSRSIPPPAAQDRCGPGATRGPFHRHILLCETAFTTESERVELLAHEMAHLLGAAHSPDPSSLMRPLLGDGKARLAKFRIGLDPLNSLAVGIWVEEMRRGELKEWGDLRPPARARLTAAYKTIAHAMPDDPLAKEYVAQLDRLAPVARAAPPEGPVLTAKQQAVRKVVRAVAIRAADLNRKPEADRPKDDALTAELVRTAASVAATEEEALQPAALLIGLGLALDHSTTLRNNPLTRGFCRAIESDSERKERIDALGSPTIHGRRDLCQHFVVSAALAELLDPKSAEAAGLLKERLDMAGTSGFSFTDIAADFAGVEFARLVHRDHRAVARVSVIFEIKNFAPEVTGLPDSLPRKKFEVDFGSESDPRFHKMIDEVRKRVAELPAYKK